MCEYGQGACVAHHVTPQGSGDEDAVVAEPGMPSAIYQGKGNVLLFPGDPDVPARGPRNAASDWVGSCAITIKRHRNRTPKVQSRTLTLLQQGR